jgi:hypothetical protein
VTRLLAVGFLALVPAIQVQIDRLRGQLPVEDVLYLRSGTAVSRIWTGLRGIAADVYWLRTVQFYGGQRAYAAEKRFDLLEPLLDITVSLDPRFDIAYKYGAIFLSEPFPMGAGDPDAGLALVERGTRAMPENWRMRQHLAFCTFLYKHDAEKASQLLNEASNIPGAPFWLRSMAATLLIKGGELTMARDIWLDLYRTSEPGFVRELARQNLERLDAVDMALRLQTLAKTYAARTGRLPSSLDDLRDAGALPQVPKDPQGVAFTYDPASGKVRLSQSSPLWNFDLEYLFQPRDDSGSGPEQVRP